jgi:uncharacterized repeat protein (TIGR04138 family)
MAYLGLEEQIQAVRSRDPRYGQSAYFFVLEALDYTIANLDRYDREGTERHVDGVELADGICEYAVFRFGPLADKVFSHWGITTSADLGEIVFNMVDCGLLNSRPDENKEDFDGAFDFKDRFDIAAAVAVDWEDLAWELTP